MEQGTNMVPTGSESTEDESHRVHGARREREKEKNLPTPFLGVLCG